MKVRVGVIGPADSVKRIMYVAMEFEDTEFVPFIYEELTEIDQILKSNLHRFDQWFFSGVMNYTYAFEKKLIHEGCASYPPLHGSSFFGTLLEAQLEGNKVYQKISMDTISKEEVEKILSFYKLDALTYYIHPFEGYKRVPKLADFHKDLYEQGEIDIVVTAIKATYQALKKEGIPVYRVTPSYLSIKLSCQLLIERAQTHRYKNAQMAVIGCHVDFNTTNEDDLYYSFKMRHNELDLKRSLLRLTEKINGSLMQLGDGLFLIFTTRGELNPQTDLELLTIIEDMKLQSHLELVISIGFGETVSQAEQHVRYGFRNRIKSVEQSLIFVDEDQTITTKNTELRTFTYETIGLGANWQEKIQYSGISPGIVSKIVSYAKQYSRTEFTSQDVSRWLQSSERNGRRILAGLEKAGIIEQCGEAQSGERGRPRRVFCFV